MKCHSLTQGMKNLLDLTRGGNTRKKSLCCMSSLLLMMMTTWLLGSPAGASILQVADPLELLPPAGDKGLYFGFSLSHYTNNSERWLLVGAPRSNISDPTMSNSGGVYACPLSKTASAPVCREVYVNLTKAGSLSNIARSNSSEQSLGFSLASSDNEIVVCAPRRYATKSIYSKRYYLPVGMCFSAKSPDYKFEPFSPPFEVDKSAQISFLTTGSCQFGMSATYIKDHDTFALGAPGCWGWQGDTWEINLDSDSSRYLGKVKGEDFGLVDLKNDFFNLYLGYSVGSLKFGGSTAVLSSIPRTIWLENSSTNTSFGPTVLMQVEDPINETFLSLKQLISPTKATDEVSFSLFGYSLATLDLNGDGMEDLVVGAPLYQHHTAAVGYDHGAIFVYMQIQTGEGYQMKEEENAPQRIGSKPFSRFGSCLAAVGDLDGDGYEDLAVGAPFMAADRGSGAVYIYMGSSSGLEKDPFQIIKAAPYQYGFGSSIAQQLQIVEGKGYDVAVGIYDSDQVLVFKSKEVVVIVAWDLTFSDRINLSDNNCECIQYSPYQNCPCVDATYCLKYQRKIKKFQDNERLDFNITLATDKSYDLFFENEKVEIQNTVVVKEGEKTCKSHKIMAKPDKKEIMSYTFTYELSLAREEKNIILERQSVLKKEEHLDVFVHCGSGTGNVSDCQSDISLHYEILAPYTYDSQPMKINFTVENQGETAYVSRLIIKSADVFNIKDVHTTEAVMCDQNIKKEIECEMGHLAKNYMGTFTLELTPSKESLATDSLKSHGPFFDLMAEVKTLSSLSNPDAAVKNIKVDISVPDSLDLTKKPSEPSIAYFNSSSYYLSPEDAEHEEELGPEINHTYNILNLKDYQIFGANLIIYWPLTISEKYFLYLMEEPEIIGMKPICNYANGKVDPFNLAGKPTGAAPSPDDHNRGQKSSALSMGINSESPAYMTITCHFGEFSGGNEEVTIKLRSRLVLRTLDELKVGTAVQNASSFAELQISKMPFNVPPPPASHSGIDTKILYRDDEPEIDVPIWLYIVSAAGGLLVLGLLIFILWKCGFFKRQRVEAPDKAMDNQEPPGADEDTKLTDPFEEKTETPHTPMLKETECASGDFEFHGRR